MVGRIAGILSLLAFGLCLCVGGFEADNPFITTVKRALEAMVVTLIVGLIMGAMIQKMLNENLKVEEEKLKKNSTPAAPDDR